MLLVEEPEGHLTMAEELPVTMAEPVYNDQGFAVGFRVMHPPGVECVFDQRTHKCSCGRPEPVEKVEDADTE